MTSRSWIPYIFAGVGALAIAALAVFSAPMVLVRFTVFFLISLFVITASIYMSFVGPDRFRYKLRDWKDKSKNIVPNYDREKFNIVLDTHSHTRNSPDGALTLVQSIAYHKAVGFNAAVITNHNLVTHLNEIKKLNEVNAGKFLLIPGMEWTTGRIHMCFIGIDGWSTDSIPYNPTDEQIRSAIDEAHARGGVVTVCHYPWSTWGYYPRTHDHPTREQVYDWGADFIEVACWDDDKLPIDYASYTFVNSPTRPNIGPCCGTDVHEPYTAQICGWTLLKAEDLSIESVMEQLRRHRTEALLLSEGKPYPFRHRRNTLQIVFAPLVGLGRAFRRVHLGGNSTNVESAAIAAWVGWIETLFVLFEILRVTVR